MAEKHINAKGLQCPGPIMQLFNAVKNAARGDIISIEVSDQGFKKDVAAWCKKTGNELLTLEEQGDTILAKIKKG